LKVVLKVLGATDLVDRDKGSWGSGLSDPYCTVTFNGKQVISTPSVDNDLNPVWTTKNAAEPLTVQPGDRGSFIFVVMDKNVSSDSFLGMGELSLDTIRSFGEGIFEKTVDLGPRPGEKDEDILKAKTLGKVKYSLSITSALSR
jgi:Ca2+-dependent lipid-binding protein